MKLDIEGHELEALKGAAHLLESRPMVIAEYNHDGPREELFRLFDSMGWAVYVISAPLGKPVFNRMREPYFAPRFGDIYCVPPGLDVTEACELYEYPHAEMRAIYG